MYEIIYFDKFIENELAKLNGSEIGVNTMETLREYWDDIREGYNFLIAIGNYSEPMYYSVPYFNEQVLGGEQ